MTIFIRKAVTILILGCLLSLNSVALPQVVLHSLHHDHHSSSTHNSTICFWVCTAGQMEESSNVHPNQIAQEIDIIHTKLSSLHPTTLVSHQYARGPPALFFAS